MRFRYVAIAVLLLLHPAPPAVAGPFEDAYAAYQNGDYVKAAELYQTAADGGSTAAMVSIGYMYEHGYGFRKDLGEALYWYRKAAEGGHSMGMFNIGVFYRDGLGVKADHNEALRWFRKAADAGAKDAYYSLAQAYNNGWGVKSDYAKAADYMFDAIRDDYAFAIKEMTTNARAWRVEFRRALQRRLRDAGVYRGSIDGAFGPATNRAIRDLAARKNEPKPQKKADPRTDKIIKDFFDESKRKGWIGVAIESIPADLAAKMGADKIQGILISNVVKNSPAEAGGLETGDLIIEWDGRGVSSVTEFSATVGMTEPGKRVAAKVLRNWKERALSVTVGKYVKPEPAVASKPAEQETGSKDAAGAGEKLIVNIPELNVFPRPDVNSLRTGVLFEGTEVEVKQRRGGSGSGAWAEVCGANVCGWVGAEFLAKAPAAGEPVVKDEVPKKAEPEPKQPATTEDTAPDETEGLGTLD